MKKNIKLVLALALAMMMIASMIPAMAATITMSTQTGHTYEIYQIFTGTVATDGKTLTELKYGENAATGTKGKFLSDTDLAKLAEFAAKTYANDQAKIDDYEQFVNWNSTPVEVAQGTASADLTPGYYVIRDKNNAVPSGDDYKNDGVTLYMFQVLGNNLNISAKSGTVVSEKHVDDQNDSDANDHSELKDSADYDIGDTIPYTLTFKLPENYSDYEKYYVLFSDDMSKGLTYNGDAKIYYGASDTTGAAITFTSASSTKYTGGTKYTYEIKDLKTAATLGNGDVITIKYTAYLNDNAVIGSAGNPNTYTVKFNNNPNNAGDGKPTGDTPEDTNIVFTYKTVFNKIDENKALLEGADFKLEKLVNGSYVDVTTLGVSAHPAKAGSSANKDTTFSFTGLDAGKYRLTETYTPAGYNTIDPIEFTITATHELESADPRLTDLTSTGLTMEKDIAQGTLTTSIENKSGAVLPSTGGIGTTIFYVAGSILVLAAAILLITKRRMGSND